VPHNAGTVGHFGTRGALPFGALSPTIGYASNGINRTAPYFMRSVLASLHTKMNYPHSSP
jgi:hypothetical protein